MKIAENLVYLTAERIARLGVSFIVTAVIARYLGPYQFGLISYVQVLIGLFSICVGLGLNQILLRRLIDAPDETDNLMKSSIQLIIVAATIACVVLNIFSFFILEDAVTTLVIIGSGIFYFKVTEVLTTYFDRDVAAKNYVIPQLFSLIVSSFLKLAFVYMELPLVYFMVPLLVEPMLVFTYLAVIVFKREPKSLQILKIDRKLQRELMKQAWPLIITGIAAALYMKIDQLMVGYLLGYDIVAGYSIAVKLSEILYFIPSLLILTFFPEMQRAFNTSKTAFEYNAKRTMFIILVVTISAVVIVFISAKPLILLVYGSDYSSAITLLQIYVVNAVFVAFGIFGGKWYLLHNLQILSMYRALLGLIINVLLNLLLIEYAGPPGAAIASLISFAIVGLFSDLIMKNTRSLFAIKIASVFYPFRG